MRLVHVVQTLGQGGLELLLERIVLGQRERGHQVRVVCLTRGGWIADRLREQRVRVKIIGADRISLSNLLTLRKELLKGRPDIVHLHAMPAGTLGRLALLGSGLRTVYHVHTMLTTAHRLTRAQKLREQALAYTGSAIIAISQAVKRDLVEGVGISPHKITVISGGVPDLLPNELILKNEARKRWNVPDTAKVIACVANLLPHKGHLTLLDAMTKIPDAWLLLAGEGEERRHIQSRIAKLGLDDRVKLLGRVENIALLWQAADVAVQPSFPREGLGLAVVEANRAQVPAVVTRVGGLTEVVVDRITGLIVEPNDLEEMAKALQQLLDNQELRRNLGVNARHRFLKHYSLEGYLTRLEQVYKDLHSTSILPFPPLLSSLP